MVSSGVRVAAGILAMRFTVSISTAESTHCASFLSFFSAGVSALIVSLCDMRRAVAVSPMSAIFPLADSSVASLRFALSHADSSTCSMAFLFRFL